MPEQLIVQRGITTINHQFTITGFMTRLIPWGISPKFFPRFCKITAIYLLIFLQTAS